MMLNNITRIYYLPSGGYSYPPEFEMYQLTKELNLYMLNENSSLSLFEFYFNILNRYSKIKFDILDLYVSDFYFLLIGMLIQLNKNVRLFVEPNIQIEKNMCSKCGQLYTCDIDLSDIHVNMYNKFTGQNNFFNTIIHIGDYEFKVNKRRCRNNIEFSNLNFTFNEDNEEYLSIIYYCATQIDGDSEKIFYELSNLTIKELYTLYIEILKFENKNGIVNLYKTTCNNCGHENIKQIFDNIIYNRFLPGITGGDVNKENYFKETLNQASLNLLNIFETNSIPLYMAKTLSSIMENNIDVTAFGVTARIK